MTAAAGDWFTVPRLGRVDDAVGAALGAVRGAGGARARRRGMLAQGSSWVWWARQQRQGAGRIATASDAAVAAQGLWAGGTGVVVKTQAQLAR
jgi:hypothetical protein